jgi:hypothetical protein
MRLIKKLGLAFSLVCLCAITASAKDKCVSNVYMFGFAASFNDSTVYFTDIQNVDSVWLQNKTNFLLNRADYAYQLSNYFDHKGDLHRTCIVTYALNKKDINKKYEQLKNKYIKKGKFDIKYIKDNEFHFKAVVPDTSNETNEQTTPQKSKNKKKPEKFNRNMNGNHQPPFGKPDESRERPSMPM